MANLSIKLKILPGIERNISLSLEELVESFNTEWALEDRLALVRGLDIEGDDGSQGVRALANILSRLDVSKLTVDQLMMLETTIKDFKTKIDTKKNELVKSE